MRKFKGFIVGVICGALLMVSVPAAAKVSKEAIEVVYNNLKVEVNGVRVIMPTDVEPFLYKGTTYLPVRAIAEALGEEVNYDSATATVQIGSIANQSSNGNVDIIDFIAKTPVYNGTLKIDNLDSDTKSNYIKVRQQEILFNNIISVGSGDLLLNSNYSKLKATFAIKDNMDLKGLGFCSISVMGSKGETLDTLFTTLDYNDKYGKDYLSYLNGGFEPFEIELDVVGLDSITIDLRGDARLLNVELVPLSE